MDQRYGTEVWNGSFKEVWNGGMERGYGTGVVPELVPDLLFWLAPIYVFKYCVNMSNNPKTWPGAKLYWNLQLPKVGMIKHMNPPIEKHHGVSVIGYGSKLGSVHSEKRWPSWSQPRHQTTDYESVASCAWESTYSNINIHKTEI